MKRSKTFLWLKAIAWCTAFFYGTDGMPQCIVFTNAIDVGLQLQAIGGTTTRSGLAYNPLDSLYYSVNAGNSSYPVETFDANGNLLYSTNQGFDYRGAWWNPVLDQMEGNGYSSLGIHKQNLDVNGYALNTGSSIFTGMNQPSSQSCGDLDYDANEIIYYNNGVIYRYSRASNAFLGTYTLTGVPSSLSDINVYTVMYTGCSSHEIALYDFVSKRVYLFDKNTGAYAAMSQLPNNAPNPGSYRLSYANGMVWIYNAGTKIWHSYKVVGQCTAPAIADTTVHAVCFGDCNGSVTLNLSGGYSPFTYQWDANAGNQTTQTADSLCAGTYFVTITDNYSCTYVDSFTVQEPAILAATVSADTVYCNGDSTGLATANVSGGNPPYSFAWSSGGTNASESGLAAGTYYLTVTDSLGCTMTDSVNVSELQALAASFSISADFGNCDGSASVNVSGGTSPYSYQWDANTGNQITQTADSLCAGNYCVTITDSNGCTLDTCIDVTVGMAEQAWLSDVQILPNPNRGDFTIIIRANVAEESDLYLLNMLGQPVFAEKLPAFSGSYELQVHLKYAEGFYHLLIRSDRGTYHRRVVIQ